MNWGLERGLLFRVRGWNFGCIARRRLGLGDLSMRTRFSFKRSLLVASALGGVSLPVASFAQNTLAIPPTPNAGQVTNTSNPTLPPGNPSNGSSPGNGSPGSTQTPNAGGNLEPAAATIQVERIRKVYQQLLQREKDIPTSVTEIGAKQIQQVGQVGSIQQVLTQAPSVNSYQQGIGQNSPEITIRGDKDSELASSLDDIPIQSLITGGSAGSLVGQASGFVTTDEIGSVNVYPGIAAPDNQGFNALGGTVAYQSKKPTADRNFELEGGVGSFNLWHGGFEANSGALGGPEGLRVLLHYDQSYNGGYQDYTPSRYRSMLFSADKPYDGGLSHVTTTVIYNTGFTYSTARFPVPVNLLNEFGSYWNFPRSQTYNKLQNQFLFADVGDETYVNSHLIVSAKLFYEREDDNNVEFQSGDQISINNPYPNPSSPFFFADLATSPTLQPAYSAGYLSYQPGQVFGFQQRDAGFLAPFIPAGPYAINGQTASTVLTTTQTFGLRPRINVFLPHNTITIGGLAARADESQNGYVYGSGDMPTRFGYNDYGDEGGNFGTYPGGQHRTILDAYAQDKIDLFHNTLHLQPGATLQTAITSFDAEYSTATVTPQFPNGTGYSINTYTKAFLPYFGASYDITKRINIYGSYGRYSLFAPSNTYGPTVNSANQIVAAPSPGPENIHDYEGGIRYDSPTILANVDYYYEKLDNEIGFFQDFNTGQTVHGNPGSSEFKGVELNGTWRITPDWSVFVTGSWNLAKYLATWSAMVTPQDGQFGFAFRDTPYSSVPEWLANFGFEYQHTRVLVPADHVDIRAYGHYVGEQYTTFDIPGFPGNQNVMTAGATTTDTNYKQPAYTTFNLLAQYDLPVHHSYVKDLSFVLNAQNIFNLKYYQYFYQQIGPPLGYGIYGGNSFSTAVPGIPVNITFDVAAKF